MTGHGTRSGYRGGCRCAECRGWNNATAREYRAKREAEGKPLQRPQIEITCERCGETVTKSKASDYRRPGRANSYCSMQCASAANLALARAERAEYNSFTIKVCEGGCGEIVASGTNISDRRRFCDRCIDKSHREKRSPLRVAIEDGDCAALIALVRERVEVDASGCWAWTGKVNNKGYPVLKCGGKHYQVHRLVLEAKHGAPLGSQAAHHICANSICVNPDHLQPVTHRENMAEMLARRSYVERIRDLEAALAAVAPSHPLLSVIEVT